MREMFFIVFGYLCGSILFAKILPQRFCHVDVTKAGKDHNPGTFNAFAAAGPLMGMLVLGLELAKGFVPVYLGLSCLTPVHPAAALVLIAPVAGHAWPLFHFREGGKAIAVSFGVLLGLLPDWRPVLILACFYLVFSLVLVIRPHMYRSVLTFLCFAVSCMKLAVTPALRFGCMGISLIVCWKHLKTGEREALSVEVPVVRGRKQQNHEEKEWKV